MTSAAAARRIVESIADMGPRLDRSIAIVELTRIRIFGRS